MTNPSNKKTFEERFWSKVERSDGCWLWTGAKKAKGYGFMNHHGKNYHAHRVSWMLHYGPIPDGYQVLHRCDIPPCCNPSHLFLGTNRDNIMDSRMKGRNHRKPEACWKKKLTWESVREIRALHGRGVPISDLAEQFHVSRNSIYRVVDNETWVEGKYNPNLYWHKRVTAGGEHG